MDCKAWLDFCATHGDAVVEDFQSELADMTWKQKTKSDRITIGNIHQHNACNHTYSGTFTHEEIEYGFIIEIGDWNGSVVREFGLAENVGMYQAPEPTIYTFVPKSETLKEDSPGMWNVYLEWRKEKWFKEKAQSYNYDKHFAPGGKTEKYYCDWATSKGLRIATTEDADEIVNRPARDLMPLTDIADIFTELEKERG